MGYAPPPSPSAGLQALEAWARRGQRVRLCGLLVGLLLGFLIAIAAEAQLIRVPPVRTVATLGACTTPKIVAVTDGLATTDCTIGGGTTEAFCLCREESWVAFGNAGTGTVTNVAVALPAEFTVSGSPITTTGTITGAWAAQTQAKVFASPASSTGAPAFLALTSAYIPALSSLSGSITDSQVPDTITVDNATAAGVAATVALGSIVNASVSDTAAIAEGKLALGFATHSPANDPTSEQKAALAGSSGTPGAGNPYVTDADARNSNARTPTTHAASHQDAGSDELSVAGLAGLLADAQTPLTHSHAAADVAGGTFADARISASSVTQHESALEGVLDIPDLQGTVAVGQIGTGTPASGKYVDGGTGAWTALPAAGGSPAGSGSELQARASASALGALTGSSTSGADLTLGGKLRLPQVNSIANPTLSFGDGDTGIYELSDDRMVIVRNGASTWIALDFDSDTDLKLYNSLGNPTFTVNNPNGPRLNYQSSATIPAFIVRPGDGTTGIGGPGSGQVSVIAAGTETINAAASLVTLKVAIRLPVLAASPVTCGAANTEGVMYTDTSHALCYCNGTAWANLTPLDGGACS